MVTFSEEFKYCPHCGDEYRKDFSDCAGCGIELITGKEAMKNYGGDVRQSASSPISENDTLVTIRRGALLDMKELKRNLQKKAIPSLLVKDASCSKGCCGGPEMVLNVRAEDIEKANEVIASLYAESTRIEEFDSRRGDALFNPFASQTTCPACGKIFQPNRPDCPECGLNFC